MRVPPLLLIIITLAALTGKSNHEPIKVGFLADGLEEAKLAFRFAIKRVQDEKTVDRRIVGDVRKLRHNDLFGAYEASCLAMKNGAIAIIGPSSSESASHVRSICDAKEIPMIETRLGAPTTHVISLHPTPNDLARAYLDLISEWNWLGFTILYEDAPWLPVIDVIMRNYTNKFTVAVRQLDVTENANYRPRLLQVKHSGDKNIVICCSIEKLPEILKQAQQVGLLSNKHHILVTNLDMHTIDLEAFQYGGTNITGLRLINPNDDYVKEIEDFFEKKFLEKSSPVEPSDEEDSETLEMPEGLKADKMRLETALTFDAVMLFAHSLKRNADIKADTVDCTDSHSFFKAGTTLLNFMRSAEPFRGLSGEIRFGQFGNRSNFNLEVFELVSNGIKRAGTWNSLTGLETYHDRLVSKAETNDIFKGKTLKILTVDNEPYGMRKQSSDQLIGNDQYEGYGIELIQKLAAKIGFNYTFELQEDKKYGNRQPDQSWDGMIGELMADRADLAITDLTITSEREEAADFTMPFMDLGIQLLYEKPKKANPELLSFMEPFSKRVWAFVGGAILFVSISFFIMGRMSPAEWDNPFPCIQEPEELRNQFTLKNSMWFTIGAILQEGSDIAPKAPSTRIVASIWWFFTLIMISSYTANLASFLTVQKSFSLVEKVNDLLTRQDEGHKIRYGAKGGGSTYSFFKESDSENYQRMYKYMSENPDAMMDSNPAGVDEAKKGKYGFFMESSTIEYITQRQCEVMAVGEKLDEKGYGIAMKKGSLYRGPLDEAILQLQESGELARLKMKWWREKRGGGACEGTDLPETPKLTFDHVKGIFVVLFFGCIVGIVLGVIRWLMNVRKISKILKTSFKEVFKHEAKFVFEFSKNTKPSYSRKNSVQSGSNASSESRSRSRNSSGALNESATNAAVRKCVTHKDNREKV